jgi:hypothetical protein
MMVQLRRPKPESRTKAEARKPNDATAGRPKDRLSISVASFFCPHLSAYLVGYPGSGRTTFGFRASAFFRPSTFGLRILAILAYPWTSFLTLAADTNVDSELPTSSLLPPRGEIPPSFWEQYGTWIVLGAVLFLLLLAFVVWLIIRPKPPVLVPYAVQARQELEPMRQLPEDGNLLSRTSQILRRYVAAMFGLPPGELTTTEFCQVILNDPKIGAELARETSEFLRGCDVRKFAPWPSEPPPGAVSRALGIIDGAERRLAELTRFATVATKDVKPPPAATRVQGNPSGA